ncbi:urease [Photobacterium sanctipauli]|uniref:Urease n=2 Tax=Photobacterium sanctipauli TaxID=1342794 RepID=A0A2T3P1B9_9GAMM|nr:amidohydrolase [Photobacterium sanctipauli]PSW22314.1 urease [Photobacterium sanctipauli]
MALVSPALADNTADTIIINANIYNQAATAIAIDEGIITHIGSDNAVLKHQEEATEIIDMDGAFIMPGFIDNHNHVFEAASEAGGSCELAADGNLDAQIPYLKQCQQHAVKGKWVTGYGFSIDRILEQQEEDPEALSPRQVLDAIFPNQPVVIMEQTSHSMWVNSTALDLAGINESSPEPQGGKLLRNPLTGDLNGILLDNAGDIVMELAWNSLDDQFNLSYDGLLAGLEEAASHGITTIGDGRMYWKRGWYEVWQQAEKDQTLTARVSLRPWIYPQDAMEPQLQYLNNIRSNKQGSKIIVDQVKMYSDGIFINGTAKTLAPYLSTYIEDEPNGINYIPPEQMQSWLQKLDSIGFGAHIHAIGDSAIRESLNAVESRRKAGSNQDYTLTHVELVSSRDVPRFKQLNVTADFQVGSDYVAYHDHRWAEAFLGAKRTRSLMQIRRLVDTGANITLSSDWNVHDINPLVGIRNSLIMGKTGMPDINAAIDAYTINAAKSLGLDDITGTITVGKSADLVVLDEDLTQLAIEEIAETQVLITILEGEIVYDSSAGN